MGTGGIPTTDNILEKSEKLECSTDNLPETTEIFGCPTDNIPDNRFFKTLSLFGWKPEYFGCPGYIVS